MALPLYIFSIYNRAPSCPRQGVDALADLRVGQQRLGPCRATRVRQVLTALDDDLID